jgi:glutamine amidotransferase-like uncharacterized protein
MKHKRLLFCVALIALNLSACDRRRSLVLLFAGTGTSPNDVTAIETLLDQNDIPYDTASSAELDAMTVARLRSYRLIIVPGGDFTRIGNGIKPATAARLREAVHHGVNYLGICAGAFFAGRTPYNSLDLARGVPFRFYSAEARGLRKAAVPIRSAGMPTLEQYWEDGPELTGWGAVIGRYPDGTPAVVQGSSEKGWVILCGFHPEAPENWRRGMDFTTPASADHAYAVTLIRAALERRPLPQF